jgi:cytochrome P450
MDLFGFGAANSPLLRKGGRFAIDLPLVPRILVTAAPEDMRPLFTDDSLSFGQMLRRFTYHDALFSPDTFIFLEADEHRTARKDLMPHFHGKALRSYQDLIVEAVRNRIDEWPLDTPISFLEIGYQLSLDVMISIVFGVTDPGRQKRLEKTLGDWFKQVESGALVATMGLGIAFGGGHKPPFPPLRRTEREVDKICLEEIAARRAGTSPNGGAAGRILDDNAVRAEPRTDREIASMMRGVVLAGYETTAITLAWMAELISHNHDALAQLETSVDEGDLSYLDAVAHETLRMRPVIPMTGRRALADTEINGIRVRKGSAVVVPMLGLHMRPDLYDEPTRFKPERFVGNPPSAFNLVTFGAGAHRCLGANLALLETRLMFQEILAQRRFTPLPGPIARPRGGTPTLVPANGAKVVLTAR